MASDNDQYFMYLMVSTALTIQPEMSEIIILAERKLDH